MVSLFCASMRQDVLQCNSRLDCRGSLIPRLSRNANMYRRESLVSFLHKHDIIKIGPKQNAMFCVLLTNYASMLGVYDIQRSKLPNIFAVILVPESPYAHTQLSSLYLLSTFTASHVRKISGSPRPHNFNVCILELRSLGTRLLSGDTLC